MDAQSCISLNSFLAAVVLTLALCLACQVYNGATASSFERSVTIDGSDAIVSGETDDDTIETVDDSPSSNATSHQDQDSNSPKKLNLDDNKSGTTRNANKGNNDGWKCACEGGGLFLPPSLMRSLGGPGAALRLGTGGCYHKQM